MSAGLTSAALIAVPVAAGGLLGTALRRLRGRRLRGIIAAIACVMVPACAVVAFVVRNPIVGLWDAGVEGLLFGAGVLWSAHRVLQEKRDVLLVVSSLVASFCLLELASRLFLPPPPGFPTKGGPHLLLASALRNATHQPWDSLCKDIVCSVVYGDQYSPIFDISASQREIVTPRNFTPRGGATYRVLHLGDSMAFGFGLPRNETFTAVLESLQPNVQHINAAVPGTAPDAYLGVMRRWIASHKIDLVVMHIYEGNDLDGLDSQYPCCDWQSLLVYDGGVAALRCAQAVAPDLGHAGLTWLRYHNPPPYLVRALVDTSSAAAHLAAALTLEPFFLVDQPTQTRLEHIELILRAARKELEARHIALVVDVLPARTWLETLVTWQHHAPAIVATAQRAGVPVLDASDVYRDAVVNGQKLFFDHPADIHFAAKGHSLLATWLHERLPLGPATQ